MNRWRIERGNILNPKKKKQKKKRAEADADESRDDAEFDMEGEEKVDVSRLSPSQRKLLGWRRRQRGGHQQVQHQQCSSVWGKSF